VSEVAENIPVEAQRVTRITRTRVTPERLAKYVEVLSQTGSHFEASRVATPFPNEVQPISERHGGTTPPPGYATFAKERKINPEFAEACEAAIQIAIGRAESELARRMLLATERATCDKNGNIVHISKDYRNADLLLMRFLARHRPEDWTERSRLDSNVTVTSNGDGSTGARYVISIEDVRLLEPEQQRQLMSLIRSLEDVRAANKQPAALPDQNGGAAA